MSLVLIAVLFYLGTRDSTSTARKPAQPKKTEDEIDRETERLLLRAEELRRMRLARIAALEQADAVVALPPRETTQAAMAPLSDGKAARTQVNGGDIGLAEFQPLVFPTAEPSDSTDLDARESFSTSTTARRHHLAPKVLLDYLLRHHYLEKQPGKYQLTTKGLAIGGSYCECADGVWPVWREGSLDAIIQNAAWPVDTVGTFLSHKNKAIKWMVKHPEERSRLYDECQRGTAILDSQAQMHFYLSTFGLGHEQRLALAFDALDRVVNLGRMISAKPIQIVDYACGQGVASMLFIEFLKKKNADCCVDKVIFIEPSTLSLQACATRFTGNMVRIASKFDDLVEADIATTPACIKFHLFAHIMDMADTFFDPMVLARKIRHSQKGVNYFVCVSPLGKNKLVSFMQCFDKAVLISSHQGEIANPGKGQESKPWQVVWTIFRVELA